MGSACEVTIEQTSKRSVRQSQLHIDEAMVKTNKKKRSLIFWIFYYWLKIIGINPLSWNKKKKLVFSYLSLVYGCSLTMIYVYISYLTIEERVTLLLPGETPLSIIIDYITLILRFLDVSSTLLIFGFNQNGIKYIVKSFVRAERWSARLGISENYDEHFQKLAIELAVVTILYITWGTFNSASIDGFPDVRNCIWMGYFLSRIVTYNAGTIVIWGLVTVKHKFHRLNDTLRSLMVNYRVRTNEIGRCNSTLFSDRLNMISELHRELRDLVYRIQRYCLLSVFCNILTQFLSITQCLHIMYRTLEQHSQIMECDIIYLIGVSTWIVIPLIVLAVLSDVCESTANEANETGNILHAMMSNSKKFDCTREAANLNVTSLDLLQNRVRLSAFGIFDLDSSLVYNTIATVTTYLIIMLQFYG